MAARPRHDWFQSDVDVVLTILKRGVALDDCHVAISDDNSIVVKQKEDILFDGVLASTVKKDDLTVKCTPAKIEIRLPKAAKNERWQSLLKGGHGGVAASLPTPMTSSATPESSTTTTTKKNWDAIEKQAVKEEEEEKLDGDAAVNKMFRKLYDDANDDVRRAMMKSYSESGGTVLSTNWSEISKKKTEIQPPSCMEYKEFEK